MPWFVTVNVYVTWPPAGTGLGVARRGEDQVDLPLRRRRPGANSDVLPDGSVAVAEMYCPGPSRANRDRECRVATLSVVTLSEPISVLPWPNPV